MQVQKTAIVRYLEGGDKNFVIPVYQRDYAWTKDQCLKLWQDLLSISDKEAYFIGTIVFIRQGINQVIIDGQQRLTTCSILLLAMHNNPKIDNKTKQQIADLLWDKYANDDASKIKLKPNKVDRDSYESLLENQTLKPKNNIVNNYNFFASMVKDEDMVKIFGLIKKLQFVSIELDVMDDPQLIFESLNSTGVNLTAGDLIRNYILMDVEPNLQEQLYKNFWLPIEQLVGDVAEFARIYLIYKEQKLVRKFEVYEFFKKYIQNQTITKLEILEDLLKYSQIYSFIIQIQPHDDYNINQKLENFKKLEFSVASPFLLDVFDSRLTGNQIYCILEVLESYVFRKILVDGVTSGLNKLFITLAREIKLSLSENSLNGGSDSYPEIFKSVLLSKNQITTRFPSNEELTKALLTKNIYDQNSKNKRFLLENLENYNNPYKFSSEIWDNLTIEHIMPQKLTPQWKDQLGADWHLVHTKYIHTLGNLTLVLNTKNAEMGNRSFGDKQVIDFDTSKLKLTNGLSDTKTWTEENIVARSNGFAQEITQIWAYPTTNIVKTSQEDGWIDLDIDFDPTFKKIINLKIDDKIYAVSSWSQVLVCVCGYAFEYSSIDFLEYIHTQSSFFSIDKAKLRSPAILPIEAGYNYYVETNKSAKDICKTVFAICDGMKANWHIKIEVG